MPTIGFDELHRGRATTRAKIWGICLGIYLQRGYRERYKLGAVEVSDGRDLVSKIYVVMICVNTSETVAELINESKGVKKGVKKAQ